MSRKEQAPSSDLLAPLRSPTFLSELKRKVAHLAFIVLPLDLLYPVVPWPRSHRDWTVLLLVLTLIAVLVDTLRLRERRVRRLFREFFGGIIREHEKNAPLGSTYLLLSTLLAVGLFPPRMAAAAIGFTVLGDGFAAIVGRAWGRTRVFSKTLEGGCGGFVMCLVWAAFMAGAGWLPWWVVTVGALVASLAELLPIPLDDNLAITLFAGYAMRLLWSPA